MLLLAAFMLFSGGGTLLQSKLVSRWLATARLLLVPEDDRASVIVDELGLSEAEEDVRYALDAEALGLLDLGVGVVNVELVESLVTELDAIPGKGVSVASAAMASVARITSSNSRQQQTSLRHEGRRNGIHRPACEPLKHLFLIQGALKTP